MTPVSENGTFQFMILSFYTFCQSIITHTYISETEEFLFQHKGEYKTRVINDNESLVLNIGGFKTLLTEKKKIIIIIIFWLN